MERLQSSPSVLGWNYFRGVILSWERTTPGESFCPGIEDFSGVILFWDGTTTGEAFCSGMVLLSGSHSVMG